MKYKVVLKLTGYIWLVLSVVLLGYLLMLLAPNLLGGSKENYDAHQIAFAMLGAVVLFASSIFLLRMQVEVTSKSSSKEAIAVVCLAWVSMVAVGSVPYLLHFWSPTKIADALFESAAGFSTTGASIFDDVESLPKPLLLWRSLTQWIGGMGIMVFFIAVVPRLGLAGKNLYRSEVPGSKESVTPHIRDMGRRLWLVYCMFTAILFGLLWCLGMNAFDALCHAFTTMSTGGFSTSNTSLSEASPAIQWVVCLFMVIAATNFTLYLNSVGSFRNAKIFLQNTEFKFYALFLLIGGGLFASTLLLATAEPGASVEQLLRQSFFTVTSLITTTGFSVVDYERFPMLLVVLVLLFLFVGGCSGSTAGGIKLYRILIVVRSLAVEVKRLTRPDLVISTKIRGEKVSDDLIQRVFIFGFAYLSTVVVGTAFLHVIEHESMDFLSCLSAAASCVGNIGPGLGEVGPTDTFSHLKPTSKLFCSALMIMGRLELFTFLVVIHPSFWKR